MEGNKTNYTDEELINMLFESERSEHIAISYILRKNSLAISKSIGRFIRNQEDINSIKNEGLVILISNIRALKFKGDSSIHTYYVGICKILSKRWKSTSTKHGQRKDSLELIEEQGEFSQLIEKFEKQNENAERLKLIYALITEKCRSVLELWARGYKMEEIRIRLGYKNTQIVMNKKNTCLKNINKQLQERKL